MGLSPASLKAAKLQNLRLAHNIYRAAELQRWQLIVDAKDNMGASLAEIGAALGVPRQTARVRVRQAYRGLGLTPADEQEEQL